MCSAHDDQLLNNYMYSLQEKNVVLSMVRLAAAFLRGWGDCIHTRLTKKGFVLKEYSYPSILILTGCLSWLQCGTPAPAASARSHEGTWSRQHTLQHFTQSTVLESAKNFHINLTCSYELNRVDIILLFLTLISQFQMQVEKKMRGKKIKVQ